MFRYKRWKDSDDDANLRRRGTVDTRVELGSLNPSSNTNLRETDLATRMHNQGSRSRELEESDGENDSSEESFYITLRVIKVVSLLLIGACALVGMVFSKITFVSITSRMYTLCNSANVENNKKSVIFFQLVFILVIPELLSLLYCLIWGFIGKTSRSFPWPSWKAMVLVSAAS